MLDYNLYPPPHQSWAKIAAALPPDEQEALLASLKDVEVDALQGDWLLNARREQLPPPGNWFIWVLLAGRGFGKNYTGSKWLVDQHQTSGVKTSAIVAATAADLRRYCIEGQSGILSQAPDYFYPKYIPSKSRLEWPDGGITNLYTSEKPNRLRGANHEVAWCDELSWWNYAEDAWNMLMLTLRYGKNAKCVVTMTPRPIKLLKELLLREGVDVVITRGSTLDNRDNLSATFIKTIISQYEGTRLGRQEIGGELLMDVEGALWNHEALDKLRIREEPECIRKVVAVDPSTTSGENADEAGIIVAGRYKPATKQKSDLGCVIADYSMKASPNAWASKAVWAYHEHEANIIVAEKNQGGEMISNLIHGIDRNIPVKLVHASVNKVARAEPVAAKYEQELVSHIGIFPQLEDELCTFVPGEVTKSPNRLDALVWALTELLITPAKRAGTWGHRRKVKDATPHIRTRSYRVRTA